MTTRYNAADRLCLTCGKTSDRKAYVGPKCGKCVEQFGVPKTAKAPAPKPMKLGAV